MTSVWHQRPKFHNQSMEAEADAEAADVVESQDVEETVDNH
jgi:hypothetical protein